MLQNVFEELDAPNEYFFDQTTNSLYFFFNSSTPGTVSSTTTLPYLCTEDLRPDLFVQPPPSLLTLPTLPVFFNVKGSETSPVTGVTLQGLTFTAGAPTFMAPRSVPSA